MVPAGPQPQFLLNRNGPRRTQAADPSSESSPPGLNSKPRIRVVLAEPHLQALDRSSSADPNSKPRISERSRSPPNSAASAARSQWFTSDPNSLQPAAGQDQEFPVGSQLQARDRSGPRRTSTTKNPRRSKPIEGQKECHNICWEVCQNSCQIECREECQDLCHED